MQKLISYILQLNLQNGDFIVEYLDINFKNLFLYTEKLFIAIYVLFHNDNSIKY